MAKKETPTIVVIGTASLDVLHLTNGQTVHTAGGAGLYTALAARCAGANVTLFAPRPEPVPKPLKPVVNHLHWVGPKISPDALPRLEIEHHGDGKATLLDASWGAEAELTPNTLPPETESAAMIHIAALSSAQRQLDFLAHFKKQEATRVSMGTYAQLVYNSTALVHQLFEQADLFFMNENEAAGLFGSVKQARAKPQALLFVTLGEAGALVIQENGITPIAGHPTPEVDPTGAGDTFCGATLAGLLQGKLPQQAAQQATALAAQTVSNVGITALLPS